MSITLFIRVSDSKRNEALSARSNGTNNDTKKRLTIDDRHDTFGHARLGSIGEVLAKQIMDETPYEARAVALAHPQRGGAPSPVDRIMGLLFGARAADTVANGDFGKMVSARGVAGGVYSIARRSLGVQGKLNALDVERHYDTECCHIKDLGMDL